MSVLIPAGHPDPRLKASFLDAMGRAAASVSVVTTSGSTGRFGLTVSAMSSVSADAEQPMLLVCLNRASETAPALIANGSFCVNLLRHEQSSVSDRFAGRTGAKGDAKFLDGAWVAMPSGAPRLLDPLVAFDCRIAAHHEVGTHLVVFGAVSDVFIGSTGSALIYADRSYGTHAPAAAHRPMPQPAPVSSGGASASSLGSLAANRQSCL